MASNDQDFKLGFIYGYAYRMAEDIKNDKPFFNDLSVKDLARMIVSETVNESMRTSDEGI